MQDVDHRSPTHQEHNELVLYFLLRIGQVASAIMPTAFDSVRIATPEDEGFTALFPASSGASHIAISEGMYESYDTAQDCRIRAYRRVHVSRVLLCSEFLQAKLYEAPH